MSKVNLGWRNCNEIMNGPTKTELVQNIRDKINTL